MATLFWWPVICKWHVLIEVYCRGFQSEEPSTVTLGPDNLTDDNPLSTLEAISAASFFRKAIDETANNDVQLDSIDPIGEQHQDSLAVEGTLVESRVLAPLVTASTDAPEESATALIGTDEEEIDIPTTEEVDDPLPPSSRHDEGLELISNDELDAEAAERNIEVSVSSSISSVSQSSNPVRVVGKDDTNKVNMTVSPIPAPPQSNANLLSIDSKTVKPSLDASEVISSAPPSISEAVDPLDYDYSNMELPPSLPNLE